MTEKTMTSYRSVAADAYQAMQDALRDAPQYQGMFTGNAKQKAALVQQMRDLFDSEPGDDPVYLKADDVAGLADRLAAEPAGWSPADYAEALDSLTQ